MDRVLFHGISAKTRAVLKVNRDFVLKVLPDCLDIFYDHISDFPETKAFFGNREHMMHAKAMQLRHWGLILEGEFGENYVASVMKIGEVHNRIGLEPKWYIGAYNFLLCLLLEAAWRRKQRSFHRGTVLELQQALTKAAMIDMDYVIAVYLDAGKRDRIEAVTCLTNSFQETVGGFIGHLNESARELDGTATEMSALSNEVLGQSSKVANASGQTSANVRAVATASEELVGSIVEISRRVTEAARLATEATKEAERASTTISELSAAAQNIGDVINIINHIAGQTNLLALNATIEAARAGDQGRGFAIVATEVKTLATQTAQATERIEAQIMQVRGSTEQAVGAINRINNVITTLNGMALSVAEAMERQGGATKEISDNIHLVAIGTSDVASNIAGIARSATDTARSSDFVLSSAKDLSQRANSLHEEVQTFLNQARVT